MSRIPNWLSELTIYELLELEASRCNVPPELIVMDAILVLDAGMTLERMRSNLIRNLS